MRYRVALIMAVVTWGVTTPLAAEVWYVNKANQSGIEDGLTWGSAFTTIQAAIEAAAMYDDVYVAQGIYDEARTVPIVYPGTKIPFTPTRSPGATP